jgi:tetratricopeptide (TPR) repeat protein
VYRGFNLGSAVLFTASAAQAGLYLAETQTYIRHARRLAEGKPGLQRYLTAIGSTIRSNIALQHLRSHHYSQADSCYRELVAGFRSQQDTAALIGALSNQSGLYDRMALATPADSVETRKMLETKAYQAIEEAIALARSYLKTHPENSQVLRALLYLLANKSGWVTTNDAITPEEKKELLSLLLETLRLARETEQPGRELLLAQTRMIRLLRVLERYQKALETSAEVLKTCQELNLPDREAAVYEERSDVYWDMGQYDDALSDIEFARQRYAVVNDLAALIQLCERAMARIDALPALKRHQFRQERARFEALGQEYRQQAKAAGQVVPGDKP